MFFVDSVFCQERGSQSSSAAARNGCGSVISVCASNEAIADAQNASRNAQRDSVRGTTGSKYISLSIFTTVQAYLSSVVLLSVI